MHTAQSFLVRSRRSLLACFAAAGILLAAPGVQAGNAVELGAGWENLGALRDTLEWTQAIQGSRKDVPVFLGWRHIGQQRVYWAPSVRLNYTRFWSMAGGGNALGATLAPLGLGVYLSRPPSATSPEERRGRWFVTATLSASVQLAGNVTPDQPHDDRVPDPEAHRTELRIQKQSPQGIDILAQPQHYPYGNYAFTSLGLPLRIEAWRMVTNRVGVGFFIEAHPLILEWEIRSGASSTPAYGYSMTGGITTIVF